MNRGPSTDRVLSCRAEQWSALVPDGPPRPVEVTLIHDSADPHAVQLIFHASGRASIAWLIGWDLLREGLDTPAGVGDVRIEPSPDNPAAVLVALSSPSGHAVFSASRPALTEFVDTIEAVGLRPAEQADADFDAELADLLKPDEAR